MKLAVLKPGSKACMWLSLTNGSTQLPPAQSKYGQTGLQWARSWGFQNISHYLLPEPLKPLPSVPFTFNFAKTKALVTLPSASLPGWLDTLWCTSYKMAIYVLTGLQTFFSVLTVHGCACFNELATSHLKIRTFYIKIRIIISVEI